MRHLCFVVSSPMTAMAFLRPHLCALQEDHHVTLVANSPNGQPDLGAKVERVHIPIERHPSPGADALALGSLIRLFQDRHFDAVHSMTPKAGLLAMWAARLARVPRRIHTFTGQVWATRAEPARALLKEADRLLARCTTHALVDSPGQRTFLEQEGVIPPGHGTVLGYGSVCGVDPERFRPNPIMRAEVRRALGIPPESVLLLFLGRMHRDKGIFDLALAFERLSRQAPNAWLMLVGPDEGRVIPKIQAICGFGHSRLRWIDFSSRPEDYLAAADICCLPSYREGFGTSLIEAAACGLPAVASRIYGITDAVADGQTGLLHPPGDTAALFRLLSHMVSSEALRRTMGDRARARALSHFLQTDLVSCMKAFYRFHLDC